MNPYYRNHRTPVFKTDHPEQSFKNIGHLLNTNRVANMEEGRARMYTAWEPPKKGDPRQGKKIIGERPKNDGKAH